MSSVADIAFHRGCEVCGDPTPEDRDAARRISDEINFHLVTERYLPIEATAKWIAVRLSDGGSDHELYPTKADAVRFAPRSLRMVDARHGLYIQIPLTGMPPAEALHYLKLFRQPWLDTTAPVDAVNPYQHHPLTLPPGVSLS